MTDAITAAARLAELFEQGATPAAALEEAWLLVAHQADPAVCPAEEVARLDALAAGVREPTLDGLRRHLFRDLGFQGDRRTYYDPANSLLPSVLRRRRGIPISLSVLCMTVGARIGVPLDGVGMPSHFLLRDRVDPTVFVDAFDNGAVLDAVGCEGLWRSITASDRAFDPAWLEPVGPEEILARMLANLSSIYRAHGDHGALVWVHELRAAIPGIGPTELIELGAALVGAGQLGRAAAAFDLAAGRLDGELAARCRRSAAHLRARLN